MNPKVAFDKKTLEEAIWELELGYTSYIPMKGDYKGLHGKGYEEGIRTAIEMLKEMQKIGFIPFRKTLKISKKQIKKRYNEF